jgi:hypothetical protein
MDTTMETARDAKELRATLLNVAWLAIALGIAIEVIILGLAAAMKNTPGADSAIADLVGKISWSMIVCVGLAFGKAASGSQAAWTGVSGLLAAPAAFNIARTAQKTVAYGLGVAGSAAAVSPFLLASLKGLEYALLGVLLTWIGKQRWGGATAHLGIGLFVGTIFGGVLIGLLHFYAAAPPPTPALVTQGVNEVLFPVGCSLAIFAADTLGKKVGR